MTSGAAAAAAAASFLPDGFLADLLAVSLTGVNVLRPLYGAGGELDDFALEYLNPAAQRMTGLSERPGGTTRTHFPALFTNGVFAFYKHVFEASEAGHYDLNYQADGFDAYFRVAARRSGDWLVVSFTDTSDEERSTAEQALRESQAAEQAARQAAERERGLLQALLTQAPVAIGLFQGPELRITAANDRMAGPAAARPAAQLLDRPLLEALPELQGQGFDEQLSQVLATRVPIAGTETPARMLRDGQLQTTYYNFVYQPLMMPRASCWA